jgi:hypothetical protein
VALVKQELLKDSILAVPTPLPETLKTGAEKRACDNMLSDTSAAPRMKPS